MTDASPTASRALPQRFLRSATSNYLTSFVSIALALLVTPILVRGLGKDAYGTWALVTSSVLYYSVLNFGMGRAAVKFVAESNAAGDISRCRRVVSTTFLALSLPAILLVVATPVIAALFPVIFDLPPEYEQAAVVLVVLSALDFAIGMPCDAFGATLVGLQRYDLLNLTLTGTALAQAAAWAVIIWLGGGLVALGVATLTFSLVSNVVRYLMVRRLLKGIHIGRGTFDRGLVKPLLSMSGWIAVSDLVEIVTVRLDPLIVALVAGVPEVAVYSVGQKLAAFVERLSGPAIAMFYPHAAELSSSNDRIGLQRALLTGTRLALGLTVPLALVVSVLAEPALEAWVGSGFGDASTVVVFLSLTTLVLAIPRVGIYILRGLGDVSFAARVGVFEAIVNLSMSIVLGRALGIEGVALGTLIGVAFNHLLILLPYVCRRLEVRLHTFIWMIVRAQTLPAASSLAVGFALRPFAFGGLFQLAVAGTSVLAAYFGVFALTGVSGDERRHLAGVVARKVRRRGI